MSERVQPGTVTLPEMSDSEKFRPSLTMRPHHFWLKDVQSALLRTRNPHKLDTTGSNRLIRSRNNPGYLADLLGSQTDTEIQEYVNGLESYFTQLSSLPDDSFINLDMQPDGLCAACVIGRHCTSTNYRSNDSPRSTVQSERESINRIRTRLIKGYYIPLVDYIIKPTCHILQDLGGRELNDSLPGVPTDGLPLNSLIVRTGALRGILKPNPSKLRQIFAKFKRSQ